MQCPHCLTDYHAGPTEVTQNLGPDTDGFWIAVMRTCSKCERYNLELTLLSHHPQRDGSDLIKSFRVYPKGSNRPPVPPEVTAESPDIAEDYTEACLVFLDSPKASAALARRCLQNLLREKANITPGNLSPEIDQVLKSGNLPSHLSESIDAIRNVGNFAAHPNKSQTTGEILPVEPGEADWSLDVLEMLFDFYYVQPAITKAKRDALNQKLSDAGQNPMK